MLRIEKYPDTFGRGLSSIGHVWYIDIQTWLSLRVRGFQEKLLYLVRGVFFVSKSLLGNITMITWRWEHGPQQSDVNLGVILFSERIWVFSMILKGCHEKVFDIWCRTSAWKNNLPDLLHDHFYLLWLRGILNANLIMLENLACSVIVICLIPSKNGFTCNSNGNTNVLIQHCFSRWNLSFLWIASTLFCCTFGPFGGISRSHWTSTG